MGTQRRRREGRGIINADPNWRISLFFLITTEVAATAVQQGGWSRGVDKYLRDRDVVTGVAYALALMAFAVTPWYVWNSQVTVDGPIAFVVDAPMQEDYCDR